MTLAEARADLVAQDRYDPSLYVGTEIDAEGNLIEEAVGLTDLLSRACVWWSRLTLCKYEPSVTLTLTIGTDTYDLRDRTLVSAKVLKPRFVMINEIPLYRRDGKRTGLWTLGELQRERSNWRTVADDEPDIAVWLPTNKLLLSAPPAGVYTGKNFIEGWTLPDDLVAGSDDDVELPVPEEDHSSIVRLALDFGTLPQLDPMKDARQFRNENWWREQAQRRKQENQAAILGRRPRGERAVEWLY